MGQSAHPGRPVRSGRRGPALLAVAVLAAGGTVAGCGSSPASRDTTLRGQVAVTVVHPDGSTAPGTDGLRLHDGDLVRTGPAGRAELVTAGRVVYVGSAAAVQVVDGVTQQLRHGAVVVDAQHGPAVGLRVAGADVTVPAGSATRAERSVTVRVGALTGSTEVVSDAGRHLTVPALHQALIGGDALPDSTTALHLTDDAGEARAVPDLVRDDEALIALARGIDATGRSTARVVAAAWKRPLSAPPGTGRSERLLPAVMASADHGPGLRQRYDRAVTLREQGGSWGVVAHLIGVRAVAVAAALASFESTQPPGRVGSVAAVLGRSAAGNRAGGRSGSSGGGSPAPAPTGSSGGGPNGGSTGSGPGGSSGGGGPQPSPSPSSGGGGLVGTAVGTVQDTVNGALSVVPTPSPSSSSLVPLPGVTLPGLPTVP